MSALSVLAASMAPGTWAELTGVTDQNAVLGVGPTSGVAISYCNSMPWNPVDSVVEIVGADHNGGEPRHMRYVELSNSFVLVDATTGLASFHGYDHQAVNPYTGDIYSRVTNDNVPLAVKRKLSGGADFNSITDGPVTTIIAIGATWWSGSFTGGSGFGAQGALVVYNTDNDNGEICAYDPVAASWVFDADNMSPGTVATYHTIIEYSAVKNVAVFGMGNSELAVFRLNSDGTSTAMPDAPMAVATNANGGVLVEEPVTGNFLLLGGGDLYELNPSGSGTWTLQTGSRVPPAAVGTGFADGPGDWVIGVSIPAYGVVMFITQVNSGSGNVYLYKHASTTTISGTIDSHLVNRHEDGEPGSDGNLNLVSLFSGFNTTTGTPVDTVDVTRDFGTVTYRYAGLETLVDGPYTVAVSDDDGATFTRSANVTAAGSPLTQNLTPATVIQVGPGRAVTHPNDAAPAANTVIEIDAGLYTGVEKVWTANRLTFRGVGGLARLQAPGTITNLKAIWVHQGTDNRVENIEVFDAAVPDQNGAGFRPEGSGFAIFGSYLHGNENGVLNGVGKVLIEHSELAFNGFGDGLSHNAYVSGTRFIMRYSYSHDAFSGHLLKSRAVKNFVLYSRVIDGPANGNASYQINFPDGGLCYVIGNSIQKGPNSENSGAMLSYGEESNAYANKRLFFINNTCVNDLGATLAAVISLAAGTTEAQVKNNLQVGGASEPWVTGGGAGAATEANNLHTSTPNFVDKANFDYRPTSSAPGINQGASPGTGEGFALTPAYHYVHQLSGVARVASGQIDIGAFEFEAGAALRVAGGRRGARMIGLVPR